MTTEDQSAFDCTLCETNWVLGRPGICNEVNRTCDCPDGFSGADDWFVSDACYVDVDLAFKFHLVSCLLLLFKLYISMKILLLGRSNYIVFCCIGSVLSNHLVSSILEICTVGFVSAKRFKEGEHILC